MNQARERISKKSNLGGKLEKLPFYTSRFVEDKDLFMRHI